MLRLLFGLLFCDPVSLLNLPDQMIFCAGESLDIIVRELPATLPCRSCKLFPLAFDLIPIHAVLNAFRSPTSAGSRKAMSVHAAARRGRADERGELTAPDHVTAHGQLRRSQSRGFARRACRVGIGSRIALLHRRS